MKRLLPPLAAALALRCAGCISLSPATNRNSAEWRPPLPPQLSIQATGDRPLRPDDTVKVAVMPPTNNRQVSDDIVDAFGMITLPLVGDIKVGGLTTSEAGKAIARAYVDGGYYRSVEVNVVCENMVKHQRVFLSGRFHKRGDLSWRDGLTLEQAVIEMGDLDPFASGELQLTRNGTIKTYNWKRVKDRRDENPVLLPNDVIYAPQSRF